jgi:hypothetical protein
MDRTWSLIRRLPDFDREIDVTGEHVEVAYVDQCHTSQATDDGIRLEVIKHTDAKMRLRAAAQTMGRRSFARAARF